jgi:hypothetical protein
MAVAFTGLADRNLLLASTQPSTDKGDPADDVGAEPTPNGARINLGAFGGTAEAERSGPLGDAGITPTPVPPRATRQARPMRAKGVVSAGAVQEAAVARFSLVS